MFYSATTFLSTVMQVKKKNLNCGDSYRLLNGVISFKKNLAVKDMSF